MTSGRRRHRRLLRSCRAGIGTYGRVSRPLFAPFVVTAITWLAAKRLRRQVRFWSSGFAIGPTLVRFQCQAGVFSPLLWRQRLHTVNVTLCERADDSRRVRVRLQGGCGGHTPGHTFIPWRRLECAAVRLAVGAASGRRRHRRLLRSCRAGIGTYGRVSRPLFAPFVVTAITWLAAKRLRRQVRFWSSGFAIGPTLVRFQCQAGVFSPLLWRQRLHTVNVTLCERADDSRRVRMRLLQGGCGGLGPGHTLFPPSQVGCSSWRLMRRGMAPALHSCWRHGTA